jgi:uncharacterized membrane protein YfcA
MEPTEIALLLVCGLLAGIVNTLAGGGSFLTVPLLVLLGLPGGIANGTNRVGVLVQSVIAAGSFRAYGVLDVRSAGKVFAPLALGALIGALVVSRLPDATFERAFGAMMLLLLVPSYLRRSRPGAAAVGGRAWSPAVSTGMFFLIGVYTGAFQAGVGVLLLLALSHAGFDLVRANALKVLVVAAGTFVALPVFIIAGQVAWLPAGILAAGLATGAIVGARLAVRGGERLIRPFVIVAVVALALAMLGIL